MKLKSTAVTTILCVVAVLPLLFFLWMIHTSPALHSSSSSSESTGQPSAISIRQWSSDEKLAEGVAAPGLTESRGEWPGFSHSIEFYKRGVKLESPSDVLLPWESTPNIVHYVWCGKLMLYSFSHFTAFVSVQKFQQPIKVVFHYWDYPAKDQHDYNLWFHALVEEYSNLVLKPVDPRLVPMPTNCFNDSLMLRAASELIPPSGGIYINSLTLLTGSLHQLRRKGTLYTAALPVYSGNEASRSVSYELGFALIPPNTDKTVVRDLEQRQSHDSTCVSHSEYRTKAVAKKVRVEENDHGLHMCVTYVDLRTFPKDIMSGSDRLSVLLRLVYYGTNLPVQPRYSLVDPIPNIGHMVLLGGVNVSFLTYLSLLSMVHVGELEAVYVHADKEPTGAYWRRLKLNQPRIHLVYHEFPDMVFGHQLSDLSHSSDLLRFQILERYGGVYLDWDAVLLRPLGQLRGYDFVTAFDWPDWHPPYPDVINSGVSAGKKNAPFMRKCLDLFHSYNPDGDWYYNGLMMPYKVYEQYPELVKIEPKMQVICFELKCHPTWLPGYHDESRSHVNGSPFDWRTEPVAIHWTMPCPEELKSEKALSQSDTMFADIARFVLKRSADSVNHKQ